MGVPIMAARQLRIDNQLIILNHHLLPIYLTLRVLILFHFKIVVVQHTF